VLEGHLYPDPDGEKTLAHARRLGWQGPLPPAALTGYEMALEGPYGDHTGYYNEKDWFPVFTIDRITGILEPATGPSTLKSTASNKHGALLLAALIAITVIAACL